MADRFIRYADILGIPLEKPGIGGLNRIVSAHLKRIPFENISKLYYLRTTGFKGIPELEQFLDGIEQYNFGGTCYANNFHLHQLLKYLGYDADLCGADMNRPDVHLVNVVRVEGSEFIADVGYGAPFLKPLPRDLSADYIIRWGSNRYVLSPLDASGCSRLTFYKDGIVRHGYRVNPVPRTIDEFTDVVADSYRPDATFMNAVMIARFSDNLSQVLRNTLYTKSHGTNIISRKLETPDEMIEVIDKMFSIPASITRVALDGITLNRDVWS